MEKIINFFNNNKIAQIFVGIIIVCLCSFAIPKIIIALDEANNKVRMEKRTEQIKIEETQDSIAYDLEKRQNAFADSISIVFMEEWTKVKDTEAFRGCQYTDFSTRWSFGGNGYAFIVVVCDDVRNISNIGPFKPTFIVPTNVQKTVANFKIYFNK